MGELGIKSTVAGGRLRVNGAIFHSDYEGIQLSSLHRGRHAARAAAEHAQCRAGGDLRRGARVDRPVRRAGIQPGPELAAWRVHRGRLADRFADEHQSSRAGRFADPVRARDHRATRDMQYDLRLGNWTLTPRVQVSYMDEQLATPFEYAATIVPSRTVADVRFTAMPTDNAAPGSVRDQCVRRDLHRRAGAGCEQRQRRNHLWAAAPDRRAREVRFLRAPAVAWGG